MFLREGDICFQRSRKIFLSVKLLLCNADVNLQMFPVVLVDSTVGRQRSRGQGLSWYRFDGNWRFLAMIEIINIVHIWYYSSLILGTPKTWRLHWGNVLLVIVGVVVVVVVIIVALVVGHLTLTLLQYHLVQMAGLLRWLDVKDSLARLTALGRYVGNGEQKIGNVLVQRKSRAR